MDTIIPQQDSMVDMDDWYNFTLTNADMDGLFGCASNPLASYDQSNTTNFGQSRQYYNQSQYPWNTVDASLMYQKTPTQSFTTANTSFLPYVSDPMRSYSPNNLPVYAGEDEVVKSDSTRDYQLSDFELALSESSASSEVEDCAATTVASQNSTARRAGSREKRTNTGSRRQTHSHRVSKLKRTASSDSDDLERALAKQTHSAIERKYRNNLNAKMWQLHRTLEGTSRMSSSGSSANNSDDSDSSPQWGESQSQSQSQQREQPQPRKSDILSNALQYINESELEMRHMSDEIVRLQNQLAVLQRMVRCEGDCDALKEIVQMKLAS
ncbi:hypothetical protein Z517_12318 [Fonsecaea pedrosoi CBS 271.37]|uniref:BHLH domain-containing protein n=1 Tax=Fonsecaea pedrosoi CBS 271.37 TaxID=1442368 RepID=A0A0D2G0S3_9EURO|nr:uncharacterized protein Z517_12318 [Fonsecaea pedrosoi CBS 271.37]KIW74378.1 hypothetical protein Z517_12318 [Fonsecaea pedrosoi CBS 271.37]